MRFVALFWLAHSATAAFSLFGGSAADADEEKDVCKCDAREQSPAPLLALYPRDNPIVTTPPVNASVGPISAGIGNVNVSIGPVNVKTGNIDIENISIGNITVFVSVDFNGGNAPTASVPSLPSGTSSSEPSTTAALDRRQDTTSAPPTITASPTATGAPSGTGISLPAPTVSGNPIDVGTGSVGASVGNITVSVQSINVTIGDVKLKNVTIGDVLIVVKLGDDQGAGNNLLGGILGVL